MFFSKKKWITLNKTLVHSFSKSINIYSTFTNHVMHFIGKHVSLNHFFRHFKISVTPALAIECDQQQQCAAFRGDLKAGTLEYQYEHAGGIARKCIWEGVLMHRTTSQDTHINTKLSPTLSLLYMLELVFLFLLLSYFPFIVYTFLYMKSRFLFCQIDYTVFQTQMGN